MSNITHTTGRSCYIHEEHPPHCSRLELPVSCEALCNELAALNPKYLGTIFGITASGILFICICLCLITSCEIQSNKNDSLLMDLSSSLQKKIQSLNNKITGGERKIDEDCTISAVLSKLQNGSAVRFFDHKKAVYRKKISLAQETNITVLPDIDNGEEFASIASSSLSL